MINPLAFALAAGLLLPAAPLQAQTRVTAEEVAQHLGIRFLKLAPEQLPDSFELKLVEVRDGKVYEEPYVGPVATLSFSERPKQGLTIATSITEAGRLLVTIAQNPAFEPSRAVLERPKPTGVCTFRTELPKITMDQPILLYAQENRIDGWTLIPEELDVVQWGAAIIISKLPPKHP